MQQARVIQVTAERYRQMAGTITDQVIARRLLDYADELSRKARRMSRSDVRPLSGDGEERASRPLASAPSHG